MGFINSPYILCLELGNVCFYYYASIIVVRPVWIVFADWNCSVYMQEHTSRLANKQEKSRKKLLLCNLCIQYEIRFTFSLSEPLLIEVKVLGTFPRLNKTDDTTTHALFKKFIQWCLCWWILAIHSSTGLYTFLSNTGESSLILMTVVTNIFNIRLFCNAITVAKSYSDFFVLD